MSCSSLFPEKNEAELTAKLETLLNTKFAPDDLRILDANHALLNSFRALSSEKYEISKDLSKDILYVPRLSPEFYKHAFSFYTLSLAFSIDEKSFSEKENFLKKLDFNKFQYAQCQELCNSVGWRVLALNNSEIFTPEGYENFLVRKDILSLLHKKMPVWFVRNILPKNPNNDDTDSNNEDNTSADLTEVLQPFPHQAHLESVSFSPALSDKDSHTTRALKFFINGQFQDSIQEFSTLSHNAEDQELKAMTYYWMGRNSLALGDSAGASRYFFLSGKTNPLGLYDSLSGQMLKNSSGKASTLSVSPFTTSWEQEIDKWIAYPQNIRSHRTKEQLQNQNVLFLETTLKSAILLSSEIRIEKQFNHFQEYQEYISNPKESIEKIILQDNIKWLYNKWILTSGSWSEPSQINDISEAIAWLLYSTNDFLHSALFVSQVKDTFNLFSERNNFLYFIFYPRPYQEIMDKAVSVCNVDPDLIYAILRQESFFSIKQNYESLLDTACTLRSLLQKYDNNIVHVLTAYKGGTNLVDKLRNELSTTQDDVVFIEFLPDDGIKTFVQNSLRNYYNTKWVYFQKTQDKKVYKPFLAHGG